MRSGSCRVRGGKGLNDPHWVLGTRCVWKARLEETKCWLYAAILVGMMNIKVLDGLAASGEFTEEKKKNKMISSGLSYLSKYQVSRTIKLL